MGHSLFARPGVRCNRWIAAAALALAGGATQAEGLVLHPPENPLRAPIDALQRQHNGATSLHLVSDYYFFDPSRLNWGPTFNSLIGGLRASTGVAGVSQPLSPYDLQSDTTQNLPYLGLGYSHLWFNSQLSLNADFGLATQNAGAAGRLRGLLTGTQSLDDISRDLRWSPVMAVNVSYQF